MRLIFALIASLVLVITTSSFGWFKSKTRDYEDIASEIRGKTAEKLARRHKMDLVGVVGGMIEKVNIVGLHFQVYHALDRNEARGLIVDCVEEMLKAYNENEEVRPYLKNYPFIPKNLDMAIFSINPDGTHIYDPYIKVVSLCERDEILFSTKGPDKKYGYKNEYSEPYYEALAIVRGGSIQPKHNN